PHRRQTGARASAWGWGPAIPPHTVAEICDAALHLIDHPNTKSRNLLKFVRGPDFPTGGVIVEPPETIAQAYASGRGSFRVRAKWVKEDTGRGTYVVVVTQIPRLFH